MPQDSNIYAVARIRNLEKGLLGMERLRRMAGATLTEAMRLLCESGYGNTAEASSEKLEEMIACELGRAYDDVEALTPDKALTDVFLLKNDILALKLLIKLRALGSPLTGTGAHRGVYKYSELIAMVEAGEYAALPEVIRRALNELELRLALKVDPREISVKLDRAYCEYALSFPNDVVREYFKIFCDYTNLITTLRLKDNGQNLDALENSLLCAGDIPLSHFIKYYGQPAEAIVRSMDFSPARDMLMGAIADYMRDGSIAVIERDRDDRLMKLLSDLRWDSESVYPVIGYLLAREAEARAVRLVITLKRTGFGEETITERLRELYVR